MSMDGTLLRVWVDEVAIAAEVSHEMSLSHETRDMSNKDTGNYRARGGGMLDWTISFEAMFLLVQSGGFHALVTVWKAREAVTIEEGTEASGDTVYSGPAILASLSRSGEHKGNTMYSGEFEAAGELGQSVNV